MRTRTDIAAPIVVAVPLALVSDIHGSDDALAAVVAALEELGIDRVVCLGDAVQGGDQPREVLDRLAQLGWPVVLGNADAFLLEVPADSPEPLTQGHLDKREWTLAQLEPSHLAQIRSFVPTLDVELDDGITLRAFHGSPHSYDDVLLPDTPDGQVERLLGGSGVDILAGGHTHLQWTRYVDGALFVNPGSVRDDGAYAIVTGGSIEFRKAPWQNAS
jgi:predicted phosphodiesterase